MLKIKKHLSLAVSIIMILTLLAPSLYVASADYSDYVPGEVTGNIIANPANLNALTGLNGAGGTLYRGEGNSWDSISQVGYYEKSHNPDTWFCAGPTFMQGSYLSGSIVKDTKYVVSVRLKNGAPDKKATLAAGISYGTGNTPVRFNVSSSEFETYTAAFVAQNDAAAIGFGYDSTVNRSTVTDDNRGLLIHDYSNGGSLYIGAETVYDMSISADAATVEAGTTLNLNCTVLNQVGLEHTDANASFNYYAVDEDRQTGVSGFSFTPASDTMSAKVHVAADVAPGRYVLMAEDSALGIAGFRKGVTIEVTKAVIRDTEPGTSDIILSVVSGSTDMGVLDKLTLHSQLTGSLGTNSQNFTWYIINEGRTDKLTEGFNLEISSDTATAELSLNTNVPSGTYYAVTETQGMRKSIRFTVDKSNTISDIISSVKNDTAAAFETKLGKCVELLSLGDTCVSKADKTELAAVITAGADSENLTDESSVKEYFVRAALVSLYNAPSEEVSLYDANGNFAYANELKLNAIDLNDVTLYSAAMSSMSVEGRTALQAALTGKNFICFDNFYSAVKDELLLKAIRYPASEGISYLKTLLTQANLNLVGIDAAKYFALSDNTQFLTERLYKAELTKAALASALADAYESDPATLNADNLPSAKPANIITNPANLNALVGNNGAGGTIYRGEGNSWDSQRKIGYYEKTHNADGWFGAGPTLIGGSYLSGSIEAGKTYVVSVRLANGAPDKKSVLKAAVGYGTNCTPLRFDVTSSEFETFTGTFTAENNSTSIYLGYDTTVSRSDVTDDNRGLLVHDYSNGGSFYIAEEIPYDIVTTIDSITALSPGATAAVNIKVVNQVGMDTTLSQEVSCKVLTEDRSAIARNITLTENADGTLSLAVSKDVTPGRYVLMVSSDAYELKKGTVIEILDPASYIEYVAGTKPSNMIKNPYNISTFTGSNGSGGTRQDYAGEDYVNLKEKVNTASAAYFGAGPVQVTDLSIESGKNYVVFVNLRNASADVTPVINFGFSHTVNAVPVSIPVTSPDFTAHSFVFTAQNDASSVWFGFDSTVDNSSKTESEFGSLHISMATDKGMYIAEETAYDITIEPTTAVSGELTAGGSITLSAAVLNQLGFEGKLSQDFEWCVLSNGKTEFAADITVSANPQDSSVATIALGSGVQGGTYHVIAKSKVYPSLVRSYPIIIDAKEDYTPGEVPANLFPAENINNINGYTASNGSGGIREEYQDEGYINLTEKGVTDTWFGAGPIYKALSTPLTTGKSYVVSMNVRNASPDITPTLYFGFNHNVNTAPVSISVTNTEFENKKFAFTALSDAANVFFGFDATQSAKTENLGSLHIDISEGNEPYIAEEIAYEIRAAVSREDRVLTHGDSITVSAELLNQLGICGNLSQGFDWQILDSNKTVLTGDFTLNVSDDTKTATLLVGSRVSPDTYYIAVNPKAYPDMLRLVEFKVKRSPVKFYVSPGGDDAADGTISAPFKTIERARVAVSGITNKNLYKSIEVILRGGEYRLTQTLSLTSQDSGTAETPVVYKAYEGETPVIKGSVTLDASKAREPLSESIVKRIRPEAQGKIVVFDLAEHGLTDEDIVDLSQNFATYYTLTGDGEANALFVDGTEQTISTWPNDREYATRGDAIIEKTYENSSGDTVNVSKSFYYTDAEPDRWAEATDWYIGAFIPYDFSYARLSGKSVDTVNKIIAVDPTATESEHNFTDNFSKRWKAYNLLEEIDLPGEYYIDTQNKLLYLYPPYDLADAKVELTVKVGDFIQIQDAHNITFEGLTFTQSNQNVMDITDVRNIDIISCVFDGVSDVAVAVRGTKKAQTNRDYWQRQTIDASYDMDIKNNLFINLGATPVSITGGNVDTLTPSGNVIENNFVSNYANNTSHNLGGAFAIAGCGITVRHNHIGNSVSAAVNIDGNDHVIEYNEMYNLLREYQDAGVIYQGKNAIARGSIIRYNYIHDVRPISELTDSAQVGVYLDDAQHELTVTNNIIKNIKIGFNSNGAGAFTLSGNTMIDTDKAWNLINQPNGYTRWPTVTKGPGGTVEFIGSQIYDRELYFEKYPALKTFVEDGRNPKYYTVFKDNFAVNTGGVTVGTEEMVYSTISNNKTITDNSYSVFADPQNQDYRIKSGSTYASATRNTEDTLDIEEIGIKTDFTLSGKVTDFIQLYPQASKRVAPIGGVTFAWSKATGATDYDLIIASDRNFEEIVYEENVRVNTCTVTTLAEGTYYWKVIANNTSRELARSWSSVNSAISFTLDSHEYSVTLLDTSMETVENVTTVKSSVINNTVSDTTDFTLTVAAYGDGKLRAVKQFDVSIPLGETYALAHSIDTENEYKIEEIKLLVWKKGTLVPLREARILK